MMESFYVGQAVFAKVRGYPLWPAAIVGMAKRKSITDDIYASHNDEPAIYLVTLYELNHTVELPSDKLIDYYEYIGRHTKKLNCNLLLARALEVSANEMAVPPLSPNFENLSNKVGGDDKCLTKMDDKTREKLIENSNRVNKYYTMQNMRTEIVMVGCNFIITSSLTYKRAKFRPCFKALNKLIRLRMNELMLLKYPQVVETILKIRNYVGNAEGWNLSRREERALRKKCKKVRRKARIIYLIFCKLIHFEGAFVRRVDDFRALFRIKVDQFHEYTKDLKTNDVMKLVDM